VPKLTVSMQHYIQTIYELSPEGEGVRISEVAIKRNVSKSSVYVAMKTLQQDGLIWRNIDRLVFLTDKGKEHALVISSKFTIIQRFLINVMGISRESAALRLFSHHH